MLDSPCDFIHRIIRAIRAEAAKVPQIYTTRRPYDFLNSPYEFMFNSPSDFIDSPYDFIPNDSIVHMVPGPPSSPIALQTQEGWVQAMLAMATPSSAPRIIHAIRAKAAKVLISHNVSTKWFEKVNSPTEPSTYC